MLSLISEVYASNTLKILCNRSKSFTRFIDFASDPLTFQTLSNTVHINCDTKSVWDNLGPWEVNGGLC